MKRLIAIACIVAASPLALAQPDQPAAAPAGAEAAVVITELVGTVEHRPAGADAWQPVTSDTKLAIGSELRTGPRSRIALKVGPNSDVTLKGLGVMTIADVTVDEQASTIRTRLSKKYGRLNAKVHHVGDLRNDYQIATPGSTLAVRGSEVEHTGYDSWKVIGVDGSIVMFTPDGSFNISNADLGDDQTPNPTLWADNETRFDVTSDPLGGTGTTGSTGGYTNSPKETYVGPGTGSSGSGLSNERDQTNTDNLNTDDNDNGGGGPIDPGGD